MRKITCNLRAPALLGACALFAAGSAFAAAPTADAGHPHGARHDAFQQHAFDTLDTDHDGVVSRAEYQAWIDARFARLDANGDGSVDANEIASSPATAERAQERAQRLVRRYDQSGTGTVRKSEFEAREMARFDRLAGGADSVTAAQFAAARAQRRHGHGLKPATDQPGQ